MTLPEFSLWLQNTPVGTGIRENGVYFPWIESVHVLTGTIVLGTISIVDLRLMGVASRAFPVSKVLHDTLPFTVTNFCLSVITGTMLFTSNSVKYAHNIPFRVKMVLLVLAGINLAVFHLITMRDIATWDSGAKVPAGVKWAKPPLWPCGCGPTVITFGRWIGFTMGV